jgi:hypothetical protein
MDNTSFDLLCKGLSTDEAKLFRKILKEWCSGDEDSFPVQLALLTRAQWLAAAQMPTALQKVLTTFEAKLASHEKDMATLVKNSASVGDKKIKEFDETIAVHTEAMKKVAGEGSFYMEETERFAREIRKQMEQGLRESDRITKSFIDERHALDGARQRYENSIEWRETGLQLFALMIAIALGFIIGWYYFTRPH